MLSTWMNDGCELFEQHLRALLKVTAIHITKFLAQILSPHSYHMRGGSKAMIAKMHDFIKPGDFVFKTDVYSYYYRIDHFILLNMLLKLGLNNYLIDIVNRYLSRTIISANKSVCLNHSIPKGGTLSPILADVYLFRVDECLGQLMKMHPDIFFYARFNDDIIVIARTRHKMRKARMIIYEGLRQLKLTVRVDKTWVGRLNDTKTFTFLGYEHGCGHLQLAPDTLNKHLQTSLQRYAQLGILAQHRHLKRFNIWAKAGLPAGLGVKVIHNNNSSKINNNNQNTNKTFKKDLAVNKKLTATKYSHEIKEILSRCLSQLG